MFIWNWWAKLTRSVYSTADKLQRLWYQLDSNITEGLKIYSTADKLQRLWYQLDSNILEGLKRIVLTTSSVFQDVSLQVWTDLDLPTGPLGPGLGAYNARGDAINYHWVILFLTRTDWCDLSSKCQVRSATIMPIHRKVIWKHHRNSMASYKLSDVPQEW